MAVTKAVMPIVILGVQDAKWGKGSHGTLGSRSMDVTSWNMMPFLGKSGMVRIESETYCLSSSVKQSFMLASSSVQDAAVYFALLGWPLNNLTLQETVMSNQVASHQKGGCIACARTRMARAMWWAICLGAPARTCLHARRFPRPPCIIPSHFMRRQKGWEE